MKSKVFKFVLPSFAFALAIVASFAFTPNVEGDASVTEYVKNGSDDNCLLVQETCTTVDTGEICRTLTFQTVQGVNILPGTPIFEKSGTDCIIQLYRPQQ